MVATASVRWVEENGVATVWLEHPPLNVLDLALLTALRDELERLAAVPPRALVLRAAGERAFSAGVDVADHEPQKVPRMLEVFHAVLRKLWSFPAPVIALVHATALGGGAELALFNDFVIASERTTFAFPEISLGCFPPVALAGLGALIGAPRAKDLILTGRELGAQEARSLGLVAEVAAAGSEERALAALLGRLLDKSAAVLNLTLGTLRAQHVTPMLAALEQVEALYLDKLVQLDDCREGVQAFLAKRPPIWKGN
jgi:cyclohexa-1,5-dienecarbonyl-CoA hydratase